MNAMVSPEVAAVMVVACWMLGMLLAHLYLKRADRKLRERWAREDAHFDAIIENDRRDRIAGKDTQGRRW